MVYGRRAEFSVDIQGAMYVVGIQGTRSKDVVDIRGTRPKDLINIQGSRPKDFVDTQGARLTHSKRIYCGSHSTTMTLKSVGCGSSRVVLLRLAFTVLISKGPPRNPNAMNDKTPPQCCCKISPSTIKPLPRIKVSQARRSGCQTEKTSTFTAFCKVAITAQKAAE